MKVRHVGITVTDLDRSLAFYGNLLGFTTVCAMDESGEHIDNFSGLNGVKVKTVKMKGLNDTLIELLSYYSHPREAIVDNITQIGCSHFALTVDNLSSLCEELKEAGITVLCDPQFSPDGKVKLTFCKDPDGTLIELVEEL